MLRAQNQIEEVFFERCDVPIGSWGGRVGELVGLLKNFINDFASNIIDI